MSANVSSNEIPTPVPKALAILMPILLIFTALTGHSMVILAIYRRRELRSFANLIILNLSVTDILFALFVSPTNIVNSYRVHFVTKYLFCTFMGVFSVLLVLVSIHTLVIVSVERFLATNYPLKHLRYVNKRVIGITVAFIWIWSGIVSLYPLITSKYGYIEKFFHCTVDWKNDMPTTLTFFAIGNALPLVIVIYCNIKVLKAAKRSTVGASSSTSTERTRIQRERRMSIVISIIIVAFIGFYSPYIVSIFCLLIDSCNLPSEFVWWTVTVAGYSCCANPVIYGVMNAKFRRAFKEILCSR